MNTRTSRAVPLLLHLLAMDDKPLRAQTLAALGHLLTRDGLESLVEYGHKFAGKPQAIPFTDAAMENFAQLKISDLEYFAKPADQRDQLLAGLRRQTEARFALSPDDRRLTHDQLLALSEDWKKNHRMDSTTYRLGGQPARPGAASAKDIDLLLDIRAAFFASLSDESIGQVQALNEIIKRLSRTRYRKAVGVTDHAMAATGAAAK